MEKCVPKNLVVTENKAFSSLQDLLDLKARRTCEAHAGYWGEESLKNLRLTVTTGFDGSGGHTNPQQRCKNYDSAMNDAERALIFTGVVLIQLESSDGTEMLNQSDLSVRKDSLFSLFFHSYIFFFFF